MIPPPIYPDPHCGDRSCNTLHRHDGHIWYHWGIGYWNCHGNDGTISLGDRYWWWSMTDHHQGRFKVVAELIEWHGGSFLGNVVDTGGHPDFQIGDQVWTGINELLTGSHGWHRMEEEEHGR